MIIPVKCYSCGTVLGDKYAYFKAEVRKRNAATHGGEGTRVLHLSQTCCAKTEEGIVLDELGLSKMCCRVIMLTHVDID